MGTHDVTTNLSPERLQAFMKRLLCDLRALEQMLKDGRFESGVRRVGAEQELFLTDQGGRPACIAGQILEELDHPDFTTELASFNLEFNLPPLEFGGTCLDRLEENLRGHLERVREVAAKHDAEVLLTGILPSLHKSDLSLENMTPKPRYFALNEAMTKLRGSAYEFRIQGVDELVFKHYSVMLEACNTSFQVHFQVGSEEFPRLYNIAQVVTAPVLAAACNSPLLFGRRLWQETRIALFQQSIDTRSSSPHLREVSPRVSFGQGWVKKSALEIFQEDIARFRVLVPSDAEEDPFALLAAGKVPRLAALQLHNSTIYRWNRPCYGIYEGQAHLRIENRVLPSGPTIADEVANAAFWFGLISGMAERHEDITECFDFDDARSNFFAAARHGLEAQLKWTDSRAVRAQDLIHEELLPLAESGLRAAGVAEESCSRYLGILEKRVASGRNGARWQLESLAALKDQGSREEQMAALTAAISSREKSGDPVHDWRPARLEEGGAWKHNFLRVEQYMTTDLFTVNEDEIVDLAANLMDWRNIRHVPVEDSEHNLVGLVSYRNLLRFLAKGDRDEAGSHLTVRSLMIPREKVCTCEPETTTLEAIELMRKNGVSCLPVLQHDKLVGVVSEHDFMEVARKLLEKMLRE